jgi:hypothetical protein
MPVPFDRPTFEQIMYALKTSGECGDILCTHAHEEIGKLQALAGAAPDLLAAVKCALADLEGIMPEFDCDGDREHPAWTTIEELKQAINKAEGSGK